MNANERIRQIYMQKLASQGGNYLDGSMGGGNYLDGMNGGKLSKKGIKLRQSKAVKARGPVEGWDEPIKIPKHNAWLEYVALERSKKVNQNLTYTELLQNIDKDAYGAWKKKHYPNEPAPVSSKKAPAKKVPVKKAPVKKAPAKKVQKKV